jgi:predicted SnoaL-like aldol condensation-catalyzing enzyme
VRIVTGRPGFSFSILGLHNSIKMNPDNKRIITNFIEEIWNQNRFNKIDDYFHPDFTDHSLPPNLSPDKEGLKKWIMATGVSFEHKTIIDEMVCEADKVMIKIKMRLKHIGVWRNIKPTEKEVYTTGYRFYKLADNKILAHWALIDGNAIENQLKETNVGCKVQV